MSPDLYQLMMFFIRTPLIFLIGYTCFKGFLCQGFGGFFTWREERIWADQQFFHMNKPPPTKGEPTAAEIWVSSSSFSHKLLLRNKLRTEPESCQNQATLALLPHVCRVQINWTKVTLVQLLVLLMSLKMEQETDLLRILSPAFGSEVRSSLKKEFLNESSWN